MDEDTGLHVLLERVPSEVGARDEGTWTPSTVPSTNTARASPFTRRACRRYPEEKIASLLANQPLILLG